MTGRAAQELAGTAAADFSHIGRVNLAVRHRSADGVWAKLDQRMKVKVRFLGKPA